MGVFVYIYIYADDGFRELWIRNVCHADAK